MNPTVLSLFSGLGGGLLGFLRAGFRSVGALDSDPEAIADLEYLTGAKGTVADLGELLPGELRQLVGPRRPDVVFTSPPCKSFSGCLPAKKATTKKYTALSSLAQRGIWLVLEAWPEEPPPQRTRAAIELLTHEGLLRHCPQVRPPIYQITPRGTHTLVEAERMAELCPTIEGARP